MYRAIILLILILPFNVLKAQDLVVTIEAEEVDKIFPAKSDLVEETTEDESK